MKYLKIEKLKSKTYYDPLTILFHANFQVLKDYVEKEMKIYDFDLKEYSEFNEETYYEMLSLRNDFIDTNDKIIELYCWYEEYDCDDEEIEDEKLKELIEIRRCLWS